MSEYRATASAGPNFSYALAARALRRFAPGTLDLSRWRIALNGAEAIDPNAVADFVAAGAPHGLNPGNSADALNGLTVERYVVSVAPIVTAGR